MGPMDYSLGVFESDVVVHAMFPQRGVGGACRGPDPLNPRSAQSISSKEPTERLNRKTSRCW